ncbi:MAG TPA: Hsp33 family molecular chaperone HslO [Salinisphaeraceae bacterium]|nr:Hsp33 family molecular chaperone HslO [Salinisphaeraceae bacterium]
MDQLQRFLFDGTAVRGEIAQLDETYRDALARHAYPAVIERLLGELLAACALLTATVKLDGTLGIEIRGRGAVSLLMAESNPGNHERAQRLRSVARYDQQALAQVADATLASLIGDGRVIITLEPRHGRRYQGIVPLERQTIAGCVETYFAQSEQLPTRLWLAADARGAAGLLLQQLPEDDAIVDHDAWERINYLADTVTATELTSLSAHDVLYRLFHEEQPRVYAPVPLRFACTCSRARFGAALQQLGREELHDVLAEQGEIETQCHFCNAVYVFNAADVEVLLEDPQAPPPTVH